MMAGGQPPYFTEGELPNTLQEGAALTMQMHLLYEIPGHLSSTIAHTMSFPGDKMITIPQLDLKGSTC